MASSRAGWLVVGTVAAAGMGLIAWQHHTLTVSRQELESAREQADEFARLNADNQRLLAAQLSAAEFGRLQASREQLARLRTELGVLQSRVAKQPGKAGAIKAEPPPLIPAAGWTNSGGSPAAAVSTVVWAAAGGDIDALAALLTFEPKHRPVVDALFGRLSETTRAEYGTPERLMALFTAKDVPLGAMQIMEQKQNGPDEAVLVVRLKTTEGASNDSALALHRTERGWRWYRS